MKDALMKYETIDAKQIDDLMERREVREPADWAPKDKSDSDTPTGGASIDVGKQDKPDEGGEPIVDWHASRWFKSALRIW